LICGGVPGQICSK